MNINHLAIVSVSLLSLGVASVASAAPPRKPTVGQFNKLIRESPFTIKPKPPEPGGSVTPLERDWMLGSIRPDGSAYAVTLINKKNRKERIRFEPGFSPADFKLLEVKQDPRDSSRSRVRVRKGNQTAWLTYDEKLIKVRRAAPARKISSKGSASRRSNTPRSSTPRSANRPPIPGTRSGVRTGGRIRTVPKRTK